MGIQLQGTSAYPQNPLSVKPEFGDQYRKLKASEIELLQKNGNKAEKWESVRVKEPFDPNIIFNCQFYGENFIGSLTPAFLNTDGFRLPTGLYNSLFISCVLGDQVSIRNVHYLANYQIGNQSMLFNIDEMYTTDTAKFGQGIKTSGADDDDRTWLEVANENGGRAILPFTGMLAADAYIWSAFRDDQKLLQRFVELTDQTSKPYLTPLGQIGQSTVIKDTRLIKNSHVGSHCTIHGANKIENATILSSEEEATYIGEGVEITDGIVGYQNKIIYGVKALAFVTGRNVKLEYGARFFNMYLSDNSTVACCEVLSNLVFPFHEQHHNNSFLIGCTVMGQSNIAAGATIGSNHNSRAADGEIYAERGFWPGLNTSFKHSSKFAAFTLVAKGIYYAEMNIHLPFCLVSPGANESTIQIFPGYWFKYNMYALARNSWKFHKRDKRKIKEQHIETDFLAPDTIEEILKGIETLHNAINQAAGKNLTLEEIENDMDLDKTIQASLKDVLHKGKGVLLKPAQGIRLFRMMAYYYGGRELARALLVQTQKGKTVEDALNSVKSNYKEPEHQWLNLGGQLVPQSAVDALFSDIKSAKIKDWNEVHDRYHTLWQAYPLMKENHGFYTLLQILQISAEDFSVEKTRQVLNKTAEISGQLYEWAYASRQKDYTNPFRLMTYHSPAEMDAVMGKIEENGFLVDYKKETEQFVAQINSLLEKM